MRIFLQIYTKNPPQYFPIDWCILFISDFYSRHVKKCEGQVADLLSPTATVASSDQETVISSSSSSKAAAAQGENMAASCHLCAKTYSKRNGLMLMKHYVQAHFYAALHEKYVAAGLEESQGEFLTCKLCPFR